MYGGDANYSWLAGGSGADELDDAGGTGDYLYGQAGHECCMRDSNDNWSVLDCGGDRGYADTHSGTSCDYRSSCASAGEGVITCLNQ